MLNFSEWIYDSKSSCFTARMLEDAILCCSVEMQKINTFNHQYASHQMSFNSYVGTKDSYKSLIFDHLEYLMVLQVDFQGKYFIMVLSYANIFISACAQDTPAI